jgi:hypothetical protein
VAAPFSFYSASILVKITIYRRDLNVIWQQYPLGTVAFPPFNVDYYSAVPFIESEVNAVQNVLVTHAYMNPDP